MKKKLLILFVATIAFAGCKKEKNFSIIGKWELEKQTGKLFVDGVLKEEHSENADPGQVYFEFKSNGKVVQSSANEPNDTDETNYSLDGNTLTIDNEVVQLNKVSNNKMILSIEDTSVVDGKSNRDVYELTFNKLN